MSERVIEKLRKMALSSAQPEAGRYRVAAAILDRQGKALSWGVNSYGKTHTMQAKYANKLGDPYRTWLHAEISALVKLRHGTPYKIIVVRVGREGELRLAQPCPICQLAIKEAGIKFVEFSL